VFWRSRTQASVGTLTGRTAIKGDDMHVLNKKQVRLFLGNEALALATNLQKSSGKNFSQTIEEMILNSKANKATKEASHETKTKSNASS
jgi:hypothetical protein|tara:strand:- start:331 stop:597 length:267 start_codon:yes stop_codon:yes gene_type:complete